MANKYVLKFTKDGYAKYTSHLDLLRFFKRAFRKSGIALSYSQGFNPHPKLGFAQPLSLGYASSCELLEFTTDIPYETESIYNMLKDMMPEGLTILWCKELGDDIKSLASIADYAVYDVVIPFEVTAERLAELKNGYLQQEEILAMKKQKKDKKLVSVNIKHMIRNFEANPCEDGIKLDLLLDCGSISNCSPELVIASFCEFAGIDVPRYTMEVERKVLGFSNNLSERAFLDYYRKKSLVLGKEITAPNGKALAIDIDDNCRLLVKYKNGEKEYLSSGEISIGVDFFE